MVRGGTVVGAGGSARADVLVRDGRIEAVVADAGVVPGARDVDAAGCLVLPGGIDLHTHFDQLFAGVHSADDFASAGAAAAAGGTTTHVDMAFQEQGGTLADVVERWDAKARRALIDHAYHLVVVDPRPEVLAELPALVERGHSTVKLFMTYDDTALDDGQVFDVFRACAATGALPLVHCENRWASDRLAAELVASGRTGPRWHAVSRPVWSEGEAVERCLALATMAGCPVYIVHVSCRPALDALRRARARGQAAYGETCPHYLALTEAVYETDEFDRAARYLCSPPIRSQGTRMRSGPRCGAATSTACTPTTCPTTWPTGAVSAARTSGASPTASAASSTCGRSCGRSGCTPAGSPPSASSSSRPACRHGWPGSTGARGASPPGSTPTSWCGIRSDAGWSGPRTSTRRPTTCSTRASSSSAPPPAPIRRGAVIWDGERILAEPGSGAFGRDDHRRCPEHALFRRRRPADRSATTTRSGAGRSPTSAGCSSACASRRSSRACRG